MEAKPIRLLCTVVAFTFGLPLIGATPLAAQGNCQPVSDALSKVITTPTHIYTTMNAPPNIGGKARTYETIYVGGSVYTKVASSWSRGPTAQQVLKQEQENQQNSKQTCHYLRDESVNGERAAVYSTQAEGSDQKSDGQVWISKTSGLPLRQELNLDLDPGGKSGKSHRSMRYEYKNVQPPLP
jgi:hypothetical protein